MRQTLAEIFQSGPFRASKQSQQLLGYIVDQSLSGHGELLKERLIGVNVFGRQPDYDTNEDPIVRARAAEVRKRLAQFYVGEGNRTSVRIEIALGSYMASFSESPERISLASPSRNLAPAVVHPPNEAHPSEPFSVAAQENSNTEHSKRPLAFILLATLTLVCLAGGFWFTLRPTAPIDLFWKPIVDATNPAILYSGANAVYMPSTEFINRYKATHHVDALESRGREFLVPISSEMKLGSNDLVAFTNDFITIGDLSANVRVASLLAMHKKRFDLRCGEDVSFSDLRQSPGVLIGLFNNSWTMELTGDLPFAFHHADIMTITDHANHGQSWTPAFTADGKVSIDYAVVTRMPHSKTGQALVAIAGITQAGTHAAADFITDPDQMRKLTGVAPKDWAQKNLQFVIQTKVVNNIPTSPVIVTARFW
ncbi:MAG: hypothetical protein WCC26_20950 [Terracidiphilus sp.]